MRGSWDADAVYVALKSGPPMGAAATLRYGDGMPDAIQHVHPDEGGLTLSAFGQPLLVDDGYVIYKQSHSHNVVLVDDRDQAGSGSRWFDSGDYFVNGGHARVLTASHSDALDYAASEQAPVYPASLGLTSWQRHVAFVRPDVVFVVDRLAATAPRAYELLWQTEASAFDLTGRRFHYAINGVGMEIVDLSPAEYARTVRFVPEWHDPSRAYAYWPARRILSVRTPSAATSALFITALAPLRSPSDTVPTFDATAAGSVVTITWRSSSTNRRLTIDLDGQRAILAP
jgi:hypothetical protein